MAEYNFEDYGVEAALAELRLEFLEQDNYDTCVRLGIIAAQGRGPGLVDLDNHVKQVITKE